MFSYCLIIISSHLQLPRFYDRSSAGGSFISRLFGKVAVSRSLRKLTPKQLGDEDVIDEDVKEEMERVPNGGADSDVVKVGVLVAHY